MSLLSTCRSTAPAPARMMTSAVPFLILFLAGVSFAERYWVDFGARRRRRAHQAFEGEEFKRFSVFGFWPNGPADGLTHFGGEGRGVV